MAKFDDDRPEQQADYDVGFQARNDEKPCDPAKSKFWQLGWVEADVALREESVSDPLNPLYQDDPEISASVLEDEMILCETGTLYAFNFMRTANYLVEQVHMLQDYPQHRLALDEAIEKLHTHRHSCPKCNEEGIDRDFRMGELNG